MGSNERLQSAARPLLTDEAVRALAAGYEGDGFARYSLGMQTDAIRDARNGLEAFVAAQDRDALVARLVEGPLASGSPSEAAAIVDELLDGEWAR